mgnify:CR=1 FL=1
MDIIDLTIDTIGFIIDPYIQEYESFMVTESEKNLIKKRFPAIVSFIVTVSENDP